MDVSILPAISALAGSLIGGLSTLTASLISQRRQFRGQALIQESVKRESLYAEFIKEASKRRAEAWSHQAESPEVIAGLYSGVERMRLFSSSEVIRQAENVIRHVIESYAARTKRSMSYAKTWMPQLAMTPLKASAKPAGSSWKLCSVDHALKAWVRRFI